MQIHSRAHSRTAGTFAWVVALGTLALFIIVVVEAFQQERALLGVFYAVVALPVSFFAMRIGWYAGTFLWALFANVKVPVVLLVLALPVGASAQSRVESFTTAWNDEIGAYTHSTYYTFETSGDPEALTSSPQVLADIYWNTLRVVLLEATVTCIDADTQSGVNWGLTASDRYMASIRTSVPSSATCAAILNFINNPDPRWWGSPQKAAVRVKRHAELTPWRH